MRRVIFFICSTILLLPTFLYAQEYKYPVQPGAPEWIMCKSYMERVDLCQIPEDVLAAMSTKDLLISCLHHPFNINIFAYDLPKGAIVDDCYYLNYPIEYDLEEINEQWRRRYPSITILANSSNSYNCHAYAWHMTEGGEDVWMGYYTNPTDIYWTDNSYKQVNRRYSGLKVAFPYDNHSAVSTSQNGILISKWGSGPLVRHSVNDCPNAFFVEWELIEGGSDVQWGEEGLGIAGITMNSSSSVGLKATAYTPDGRIESSFYFFCNN